MPHADAITAPVAALLDGINLDENAREAVRYEFVRIELARLQERRALDVLKAQLSAIRGEANSPDAWTRRARPTFLYVIYVLLLWSLPMGILAAAKPAMATAFAHGMTAYLNALPEPLYALFGTGYLGYTAARQWGKVRGVDK